MDSLGSVTVQAENRVLEVGIVVSGITDTYLYADWKNYSI